MISKGSYIFFLRGREDLNLLSRKYRVLDDCSRLRDIIQAFPQHRYFRPSILVLTWVEGDKAEAPADLLDMVCHSIYNLTSRLME